MQSGSLYFLMLTTALDICFVNSHKRFTLDIKTFMKGVQLQETSVFAKFQNSTMGRCMEECVLHRKCEAISFNLTSQICNLGDDPSAKEVAIDDLIMSSGPQWTPLEEIAGNCAYHNCSKLEKCIELVDESTICLRRECSPPVLKPNITTVTSSGARSIGAIINVACPSSYSPKFNRMKCRSDWQWTNLNNKCLNCSVPLYSANGSLIMCLNANPTISLSYSNAALFCEGLGGRIPKVDTLEKLNLFDVLSSMGSYDYWIEGDSRGNSSAKYYDDNSVFNDHVWQRFSSSSNCGSYSNCGVIVRVYSSNSKPFHRQKIYQGYVVCDMA